MHFTLRVSFANEYRQSQPMGIDSHRVMEILQKYQVEHLSAFLAYVVEYCYFTTACLLLARIFL